MTDKTPPADGRIERTLARELINDGRLLQPGETVRLRPEQIERLEPEGFFEPLKKGGR